jgi:hypothetical protein
VFLPRKLPTITVETAQSSLNVKPLRKRFKKKWGGWWSMKMCVCGAGATHIFRVSRAVCRAAVTEGLNRLVTGWEEKGVDLKKGKESCWERTEMEEKSNLKTTGRAQLAARGDFGVGTQKPELCL